MTKIHVLTAVHNDLANLRSLLTTLNHNDLKPASITVVDDGSTDGTCEFLAKNYPDIHYLLGDGQLWWTGSLNLGIKSILSRASLHDYLLTINNDCLLDPHYLKTMAQSARPNLVLGSKIIDVQTKRTWDLGVTIDWPTGKITGRQKTSDRLDALTTKGTLYPLNLFLQLGLLSSHLPHYISDYELAIRAKKHGYRLSLQTASPVLNHTQNTGAGDELEGPFTLKRSLYLLFGRRSKLNIVDQFWFITLCCPLRYQPLNYLRLIAKTIYLLALPSPRLHHLLKSLLRRVQ